MLGEGGASVSEFLGSTERVGWGGVTLVVVGADPRSIDRERQHFVRLHWSDETTKSRKSRYCALIAAPRRLVLKTSSTIVDFLSGLTSSKQATIITCSRPRWRLQK